MTLHEHQAAFCQDVAKLMQYIAAQGYSCTFGEAYRTPEQAILDYHKGIGIKDSMHCKRLAIDLNLFDAHGTFLVHEKDYEPFGTYWESLSPNNRAGVFFSTGPDSDHFERHELPCLQGKQ